MTIRIENCHFENNGTAISMEGNVKASIIGSSFKDNTRDLFLLVTNDSELDIVDNKFLGSKLESITVIEYTKNLNDIKSFVQSKTNEFSPDDIGKIVSLLDILIQSKDKPSVVRGVLNAISAIGIGVAGSLLVEYIKVKLGWIN